MKKKSIYEKPMMNAVALKNNSTVADECWGESNDVTHYYDSEGHGFVKFYVDAPNCKKWNGDASSTAVYTCQLNEQGLPCEQMTEAAAQVAIQEFYAAFKKRFDELSNGGSSYRGFSTEFPVDPHGMS